MQRNFYKYMSERSIAEQQQRIASLMVMCRVHPYVYIDHYLHNHEPVLNEWLGGFFKRLGNAWGAFWKSPHKPEDNPESRIEYAKAAMLDLQSMLKLNVGADQGHMQVVLNGLEQSLAIMDKIEPAVRELSPTVMNYSKTGETAEYSARLPEDLEEKWRAIMDKRDVIIKSSEKEEVKAQKIFANDDELIAFKHELEKINQNINAYDTDQNKVEYKNKIEKFLRRIDNDATFREIQNLLNLAKRRASASGLLVQPPDGYGEVQAVWRQIAAKTGNQNQHKQQMMTWYHGLANEHPVKQFVRGELKKGQVGGDENELFYKYAYDWMTKYPHHMLGVDK